jgi:hypothetical protein
MHKATNRPTDMQTGGPIDDQMVGEEVLAWHTDAHAIALIMTPMSPLGPICITGIWMLCAAAKQRPHGLICIPNRTVCVPMVSVVRGMQDPMVLLMARQGWGVGRPALDAAQTSKALQHNAMHESVALQVRARAQCSPSSRNTGVPVA